MATLTHRSGAMTQCRGVSDLRALVAELDEPDDAEHPDVTVAHASGWSLSAFASGLMVWENVEAGDEGSHRSGVSREETQRLFELLASGALEVIASSAWEPGYGPG